MTVAPPEPAETLATLPSLTTVVVVVGVGFDVPVLGCDGEEGWLDGDGVLDALDGAGAADADGDVETGRTDARLGVVEECHVTATGAACSSVASTCGAGTAAAAGAWSTTAATGAATDAAPAGAAGAARSSTSWTWEGWTSTNETTPAANRTADDPPMARWAARDWSESGKLRRDVMRALFAMVGTFPFSA